MKPKSLSASSLQVAETCMARYHAENILRAERPPNNAASLGTAVHEALEWYVKRVYIEKNAPPGIAPLLELFKMKYMVVFGTIDTDTDDFRDGEDMLRRWFGRTDFTGREVLSCEIKSNFEVPTSVGPIPLNYIWDRFDKLADGVYEVVDYKSVRLPISPEELKTKIQARIYGLAGQIQQKDATRIWVRFDLLRHESVAIVFTREENIATWVWLKQLAEKILATPTVSVVETLNAECRWCVRKLSCEALKSNVRGGGIMTAETALDLVDDRAALAHQLKGIQTLIDEMDQVILKEASETEILEFETARNKLVVGPGGRRTVDPERIQPLVPADLFSRHGGPLMTYTNFMKLLREPEIKEDVNLVRRLKGMVYVRNGNPSVKVVPKNIIDKG